MSKGLEKIEHLRVGIQYINQDESPAFISQYEEELNIIETELKRKEWLELECNDLLGQLDDYKYINEPKLKAFEIIKKKNVNTYLLQISISLKQYHILIEHSIFEKLTQEEYDLLKEVLLCQQ